MCGGSAPRGSPVSRGSRIVDDVAVIVGVVVGVVVVIVGIVVDGDVCGDAGGVDMEVQREVRPLPASGDPKEELCSPSTSTGGMWCWLDCCCCCCCC